MWKFLPIFLLSILSSTVHTAEVNPCANIQEGQQFVLNPRGCDLYYYCDGNGSALQGRCPTGFHFNLPSQSCELPATVNCTIDDKLWNTDCPEQGITKVPHPYSCSEYSVCLDSIPQDRSCPDGLHFSPYDQDCVNPDIANCKTDGRTCQSSEPFVPKFIPSSRNCSTYYICFNNGLQTFSCGAGQEFDSRNNQCVPEEESDCDVDATLNPDIKIPDTLTYDCSNAVNGSRIAHPESCSFWFWCLNGNSQIFWCGQEALFDNVSRTCTGENLATCFVPEQVNAAEDLTNLSNDQQDSGKFIGIL